MPPDSTDPNTIFPITVYMNAHLKIRVAMELAFEGSMAEARSIMRDAVEYAAHAHHMLKDPKLQEIWLNKLDDPAAWQAEFWNDKATKLFDGLPLSKCGLEAFIQFGFSCERRLYVRTIAAAALGLDPGIGVLHVDAPYGVSLACDLMEAVRPVVDS